MTQVASTEMAHVTQLTLLNLVVHHRTNAKLTHACCKDTYTTSHHQSLSVVFPEGTTGLQLDVLTCCTLWKDGLNYLVCMYVLMFPYAWLTLCSMTWAMDLDRSRTFTKGCMASQATFLLCQATLSPMNLDFVRLPLT